MDPSKDLKPCPTLGMTTGLWNKQFRRLAKAHGGGLRTANAAGEMRRAQRESWKRHVEPPEPNFTDSTSAESDKVIVYIG